MKNITLRLKHYSLGFICGMILPSLAWAAGHQANLIVNISEVKSNQGVIRLALFNSPQAFADKAHAAQVAYRTAATKISNNQAQYTFADLPYGVYAIKLFQDQDMSGQLKKNFLGMPREPIGFSNNPVVKNKAPTYEQTKFIVNQPTMKVSIKMIDPK